MNREIKFRAIVIDDEGEKRLEYNVWPCGKKVFVENGGFWMDYERVEEYTCLKDRKGKDVYEGDVCQSLIKGTIQFNDGSFCFVANERSWFLSDFVFNGKLSELEIIGNVFENPELLKQ